MYSIIKSDILKKIFVVRGKDTRDDAEVWHVTNEHTLKMVPGPVLTFLYNKAQPEDKKIKKFEDSKTAAKRVFPLLEDMCPEEALSSEQTAKLAKKELNKPPGVIKTFYKACLRNEGCTILEGVAILTVAIPKRKPASMENTIRINLNRNYIEKRGYDMTVTKEAGRKGKIYRLKVKS